MAYQTGTSTDPLDLLNQLATFMSGSCGWTLDKNVTVASQYRWVVAHKGSVYFNMMAFWSGITTGFGSITNYIGESTTANPGILMAPCTGYDNTKVYSSSWWQQPGAPLTSDYSNPLWSGMARAISGSQTYHFFGNTKSIHVVNELASGDVTHMAFGTDIDHFGTWIGGAFSTGGAYQNGAFGSNPSSGSTSLYNGLPYGTDLYETTGNNFQPGNFMQVTYKGSLVTASTWQCYVGNNSTFQFRSTPYALRSSIPTHYSGLSYTDDANSVNTYLNKYGTIPYYPLLSYSSSRAMANSFNSVSLFLPIYASFQDTIGKGKPYLLGTYPHVLYGHNKNYTYKQQVTIGAKNYWIFPMRSATASSYNALAIEYNP